MTLTPACFPFFKNLVVANSISLNVPPHIPPPHTSKLAFVSITITFLHSNRIRFTHRVKDSQKTNKQNTQMCVSDLYSGTASKKQASSAFKNGL